MKFNIPPGVFDLIPVDEQDAWKSSYLWTYVEKCIRNITNVYGYNEIRTPLFERTELFQRGVGNTSDIVSKEMYTFVDKGGRSMSLRPEGTAPVMRAFIEHQMHTSTPNQRLFYIAPMFRYERSQAGRYRQHHQFGIEAIGNGSAEQDAEVIDLLFSLYNKLGLKHLRLFINSLGNTLTRQSYRQALKDFLKPELPNLSPDSQKRFETNPLRILDSKDPRDREIVKNAPSILEFLDEEEKNHFNHLQRLLSLLEIPYEINPNLVRGLDYYNKTVFEVVAGELGAQNSIGGGGRYDGLIADLGGPDLPSFGFGTGLERIIQTMINQGIPSPSANHPALFFIPLGDQAKKTCFKLMHELRGNGISTQMDFSGRKVGKAMQHADQMHAVYTAVVGDHEIEQQTIALKHMGSGHLIAVKIPDLTLTMHNLLIPRNGSFTTET